MPKPPKLWTKCPFGLLADSQTLVGKWGLKEVEEAIRLTKLWTKCPVGLLVDVQALVGKWGLKEVEEAIRIAQDPRAFAQQWLDEMPESKRRELEAQLQDVAPGLVRALGEIDAAWQKAAPRLALAAPFVFPQMSRRVRRRVWDLIGIPPREPAGKSKTPGRPRKPDGKRVAHMGYLMATKPELSVNAAAREMVADENEWDQESAATRLRRKFREEGRGFRWAAYFGTSDKEFIDRFGEGSPQRIRFYVKQHPDYPDVKD